MATSRDGAPPTDTPAPAGRRDALRQLLHERRRELVAALHDQMRGVRAEHHAAHGAGGVLDEQEASGADAQEELEFALIEMKAETLRRIDEALVRLEAGAYGRCGRCGQDIARARLQALPFAVRCRDCEALREAEGRRARAAHDRPDALLPSLTWGASPPER